MRPPLEKVYLIHHSHTDIGYTHDQPILFEMERRFIDAAIDACEKDIEIDADHSFRWNVETLLQLLYWLDHSKTHQIDRFLKLEKAKRIEVMGMFANITPLMDAAELVEMVQHIGRLRKDYGITIRHAMNCDVNGQNWGLVDILLDAGIEAFSMAINQHSGGAPLMRPNVFQWQGPSGRTIPAYNGYAYAMGIEMGIGRDVDEWRIQWIPWLQERLDRANWPFPIFPVQSYHPFGDNGSAYYQFSKFIQDWNARGEAPQIRIATYSEWWEAAKPYLSQLPVHRGDWTDYWNYGSASSAREAAINRASRARLTSADRLFSVLSPFGVRPSVEAKAAPEIPGRDPGILLSTTPQTRASAWHSLFLWDEHTWGADVAVNQPENEDTVTQWNYKANFAYSARSLSLMLQRDGIGELSLLVPHAEDDALFLYNPLPWSRTFSGAIYDVIAKPRGTGDDPSAARHHQDRFRSGRGWWVKGVELPAFGYTVVKRDQLVAQDTPPSADFFEQRLSVANPAYTEEAIVENDYHRLTFDRVKGGLVSWYDKRLQREIVDPNAAWRFGDIVYERLADQSHPNPHRLLYDQVWGVRDRRGWRPGWRAERWGASALVSHKVTPLPHGIEVVQVVTVSGLASPATLRYFIPQHEEWIDLQAEWLMGMNNRPESTYVMLPFAVSNATVRLDLGGQAMQPEREQIPGSCRDYYTVQNWVDFSESDWGVTVACPENPIVQLGDFHYGHDQRVFQLERATLLGWVTNNYWETNFRGYQPGRVTAHYRMQPHQNGFDEGAAHKFGIDTISPVVIQSMFEPPRTSAVLPATGTLLVLPEPPVLVLNVLPGWVQQAQEQENNTLYVRLLNASDVPQTATIGSALLKVQSANQCDLFGAIGDAVPVTDGILRIHFEPRQLTVIRLVVETTAI